MKSINKLIVIIAASLFAAGFVYADDQKDATESKPAKCCAAAAKDGKDCTHGCCVEAAKAGQNCAKCGGSGALPKKD